MARISMQLMLFLIVAGGLCFFFIQHFTQNRALQASNKCSDTQHMCQSKKHAEECGATVLCHLHWKKNGLMNGTGVRENLLEILDLKVYYEVLCRDSQQFITNQLFPAFKKLHGAKMFNLMLIAYGNAEETKKGDRWEFTCQHAEEECEGNLIQTCAMNVYPNVTVWMQFVHCMETQGFSKAAPECAKKQGMDYKQIKECTDGPIGNKLEHEMALKTDALSPKQTFIPWITINGESSGIQKRALEDLVGLLCDLYKGKKPDACPKTITSMLS